MIGNVFMYFGMNELVRFVVMIAEGTIWIKNANIETLEVFNVREGWSVQQRQQVYARSAREAIGVHCRNVKQRPVLEPHIEPMVTIC